jgi:hypothetical protein
MESTTAVLVPPMSTPARNRLDTSYKLRSAGLIKIFIRLRFLRHSDIVSRTLVCAFKLVKKVLVIL